MGKILLRISTAVAALFVIVPLEGQGPSSKHERIRGRDASARSVIVKFRPSTSPAEIAQIERALDADRRVGIGGIHAHVLHSRRRDAVELESVLAALPQVEYVEPDWIVYPDETIPNDPNFPDQWALLNTGQSVFGRPPGSPGVDVRATRAWDITTGSPDIVIGIVDSGLDYYHSDLAANAWTAPADFSFVLGERIYTCSAGTHGIYAVGSSAICDPAINRNRQGAWHGSHVAGIAGADGNNQAGVAGINWRSSLMGLNFMPDGTGFISDAVNAIEFAIQTKTAFAGTPAGNLRVINASWGGGPASTALEEEIRRAAANDILFVAAAGNDSSNSDVTPHYPASYKLPNVIAVASTSNTDALSSFSNYGASSVHLGAPGENILSSLDGGTWGLASGTSMAAPMVSGAAALVLSRCPLTAIDLKALLLNTVDPVPSLSGTTTTGGRLNIERALRTCTGQPPSNGAEVVIHARDIRASSLHGAWSSVPDSTAADGMAVATDDRGGSTVSSALGSPADFVDIPFTAPAGVPYHLWLRLKAAADSKWNDSVFAQFSDALVGGRPAYAIGTADGLLVNLEPCQNCGDSGWGWQDTSYWLQQQATVTFQNTGTHILRIQVREDGVRFDQVVLSAAAFLSGRPGAVKMDTTVVPAAQLDQSPTVALTSPAPDAMFAAGSTIALAATASDPDGTIRQVEFFANATLVGTASAAPYTVTWNAAPGNYALRAVASDNLGVSTTSAAVPVAVALPNQQISDIVLYARDFPTVTGRWLKAFDDTAADGLRLATTANGVFIETPLANPPDMVEITFPAPAGTPYHVWFRISAYDGFCTNGTMFAQFSDALIDQTPVYRVGTSDALVVARSCNVDGWGWTDSSDLFQQPGTVTFATSGMHTLRVQLRKDGAGFDQVVLSPATFLSSAPGAKNDDTTIVPKLPASPPPPPSPGDVVVYANDIPSGAVHGSWRRMNDTTAAAGVKLETPDAGVANAAAPLASPSDYVDATFTASAGTPYTFWLRVRAANNNKYNDSVWVQFSDARAGGASVYPINSASALLVNLATDSGAGSVSAWGWQNGAYWLSQATTVTFATSGTHAVRIQVREDGVQFDQIVLSPARYLSEAPGSVTNDHTIVPKTGATPPPPPPA